MSTTTVTIDAAAVSIPRDVVPGELVPFTRSGVPNFSFYVRDGRIPATPDPYLNQEVRVTIGGTLVFCGDCASRHPSFQDGLGWVTAYQCLGSANRLERFPHTDSNTGTAAASVYNADPTDPQYMPSRAGRTVGQVIADALTMPTNAAYLRAKGVGNLSLSGSVYTLPASTTADLAALSMVPNGPVYFQGQMFWHALSGFIQEYTRNFLLHVEPGGDIRVLDVRSFTPHTFTMGVDPIRPTELSRDWHGCFPRVQIQGAPLAVMALLKLSDGSLTEAFAWGSFSTNAAAKAAWTPGQFHQPSAQDQGSCTCPDTTHIVVTSSNSATSWSADFWDFSSTGRHGVVNLSSTVVTGVTQYWTARVVANSVLSPPGTTTSTLTLDAPLPHLNFDHYTLTGLNQTDASIVWRRYRIANTALWPLLTSQSTFPQAFIGPGNSEATLTSTPMGAVFWPISGSSPPYNMFPLPFSWDSNGYVYFAGPTYVVASNQSPADVWILIPFNQSVNVATAPADISGVPQYAGTSHTVEGLADTMVVPCPGWKDPANRANMVTYAAEILDAVSDTVQEGEILYQGLFQPALTPGLKASVAGVDFPTNGWESAELPIVEVSLAWQPAGPTSWVTRMAASSRRSYLSEAFYMRPARGWQPIGADHSLFGGLEQAYGKAVSGFTSGVLGGLIDRTKFTGAIPQAQFVTPEAGRPASRTPEEQQESHHAAAEQRQQQLAQQRQAETARVAAARAAPAQELAQAQQGRREQQQARTERAQQLRAQRAERARQLRTRVAARQATGGGTISRAPETPDEDVAE